MFFAEETILYAIYDKDMYKYLGKAPELPEIQINKEIKIKRKHLIEHLMDHLLHPDQKTM